MFGSRIVIETPRVINKFEYTVKDPSSSPLILAKEYYRDSQALLRDGVIVCTRKIEDLT